MADDKHDPAPNAASEVSRGDEVDATKAPRPTSTPQKAAEEIEEEDRFEATDN